MSLIHEILVVGALQCNCSILGDDVSHEAMVVDPGDEVERIIQRLEFHRLRLKQILVTHAHIDHIAGAHRLKQRTGAPILYNQRDLPLVAMMDVQATWIGLGVPPIVLPPDASLEDDDLVRVEGVSGQVISTPGHTEGSVCLYMPKEKLLLGGDTLFAGSVGRTDLPGGNHTSLIRSIQTRLMILPRCVRVVPGHGRSTTIGAECESNPHLQHA